MDEQAQERFRVKPISPADPPPAPPKPYVNFLDPAPSARLSGSIARRILWAVVVLLLALAGCKGLSASRSHESIRPAGQAATVIPPKAAPGIFGKIKQFVFGNDWNLKGQHRDRINLLILGIGGPGHEGPYLTDTIIIASIKPSTKQVAFISIPRDLAVNIPGHGWYRINSASAFGETIKVNSGSLLARDVVSDTLNLPIDYYIRVDFQAFAELIDDVGGISVEVERSFIDHEYPNEQETAYRTVSFTAGVQTMDGAQALIYARSRHGNNHEGSDFARAKRQQKMLLALKEKLLSTGTLMNPLRLNTLWETLATHVVTDMEFSDVIAFVKLARQLHGATVSSLVLDASPDGFLKETEGVNKAFLLEPKTGNFDAMRTAVDQIFSAPRTVPLAALPGGGGGTIHGFTIELQNGTWRAGLAARLKKRLEDSGFIVTKVGNTAERPVSLSGIVVLNHDAAETASVLQELTRQLRMPVLDSPAPSVAASPGTDILVIIGDDFRE